MKSRWPPGPQPPAPDLHRPLRAQRVDQIARETPAPARPARSTGSNPPTPAPRGVITLPAHQDHAMPAPVGQTVGDQAGTSPLEHRLPVSNGILPPTGPPLPPTLPLSP